MKQSLKMIILCLILAVGNTFAIVVWLIKTASIAFYVALGVNLVAIVVIVICLILEIKHKK